MWPFFHQAVLPLLEDEVKKKVGGTAVRLSWRPPQTLPSRFQLEPAGGVVSSCAWTVWWPCSPEEPGLAAQLIHAGKVTVNHASSVGVRQRWRRETEFRCGALAVFVWTRRETTRKGESIYAIKNMSSGPTAFGQFHPGGSVYFKRMVSICAAKTSGKEWIVADAQRYYQSKI